jgi:hypothetical protein
MAQEKAGEFQHKAAFWASESTFLVYDFESSHQNFTTHQVAMEVQIARVLAPWTKMLEVIKEE